MGTSTQTDPKVGLIMGSHSDWETMKHAAALLDQFQVPYEKKIVSAHRTPLQMTDYARTAESRGLQVIIAGAGGAAHLPGMVASMTVLPVLGVPVQSRALNGLDSLLSIVQMPAGIPVGTLAIGESGAKNAALLAVSILANADPSLRKRLHDFREEQTLNVQAQTLE
ncbi:MAG: 5-(carboxyamino)imidazole ribonucleotide mutase [Bacteroidetes bacterium]|nr:5-(carboxyamino)imidazole ribonucleotide mutase [Bacteroidota bacterium]